MKQKITSQINQHDPRRRVDCSYKNWHNNCLLSEATIRKVCLLRAICFKHFLVSSNREHVRVSSCRLCAMPPDGRGHMSDVPSDGRKTSQKTTASPKTVACMFRQRLDFLILGLQMARTGNDHKTFPTLAECANFVFSQNIFMKWGLSECPSRWYSNHWDIGFISRTVKYKTATEMIAREILQLPMPFNHSQ